MQIIDPKYWMNDKEHGNDKLIFLAYRFSILLARADFNKIKALIDAQNFKSKSKLDWKRHQFMIINPYL